MVANGPLLGRFGVTFGAFRGFSGFRGTFGNSQFRHYFDPNSGKTGTGGPRFWDPHFWTISDRIRLSSSIWTFDSAKDVRKLFPFIVPITMPTIVS